MPQAFDLSKVTKYVESNSTKIITMALNSLDGIEKGQIGLYSNLKEDKPLHKLKLNGTVVQPYRVAFEPKNNLFQPSERMLSPKPAKVDIQIDPGQVQDEWLILVSKPGFDPRELPLEKFFMAELVRKIKQELNDITTYSGVYNAAGTGPVDVCNGFGKIIADAITAGDLTNVIATGAITSSNALAKFKQMWKALPTAWKGVPMKLLASYTNIENYDENYADTRGSSSYVKQFEQSILEASNGKCTLERASWIGTSGRTILTPEGNLFAGTDLLADINKITVQPSHRLLDVMIEFKICFQIADTDAIWTNDQA